MFFWISRKSWTALNNLLISTAVDVRTIMTNVQDLKKGFEDYRDKVRNVLDTKNQEIQDLKDSIQKKIEDAIKADDDGEEVEIQDVLNEIKTELDGLTPVEAPTEPVSSGGSGSG